MLNLFSDFCLNYCHFEYLQCYETDELLVELIQFWVKADPKVGLPGRNVELASNMLNR